MIIRIVSENTFQKYIVNDGDELKYIKREKNHRIFSPLVSALIFVLGCFILIYITYGVYYLSNDDTGIMKAYSGYSTGIPTPYHQYSSISLGMIYKLLYQFIPTWNWYSFGSILVVIMSNAVIIDSIYNQRNLAENQNRYIDFIVIAVLTISISMYGICLISWTINATFTAVAGIMILLNLPVNRKRKHLYVLCAFMFLAMASLIRNAAYKAILPFAVLALLYQTGIRMEEDEKRRRIITELIILFVLLFGIMGYSYIDTALKSNIFPSGTGTFEYYRGLYTDRTHIPYEGNEEFYESLGWDQELYNATTEWMFIDQRFNTENLKKIADASRELQYKESIFNQIKSYINDFWKETKSNIVRICISISIILLLIVGLSMTIYTLVQKENWYDWIFLFATETLAVAESVYLLIRDRFIDRAFYCTAFPALFIGIWILTRHASIMNRHKGLYIAAITLSLAFLYISIRQNMNMEKSEQARQRAQMSSDADTIYFNHPDNLYIYDGSIINGTSLFLDMSLRGCGNNALMWGGTGVYSTSFYEKIKRFGYNDFYSINMFDENVYYMTTNSDVLNSTFMKYMQKNYGTSVTANIVDTTSSGIYVYKFYNGEYLQRDNYKQDFEGGILE